MSEILSLTKEQRLTIAAIGRNLQRAKRCGLMIFGHQDVLVAIPVDAYRGCDLEDSLKSKPGQVVFPYVDIGMIADSGADDPWFCYPEDLERYVDDE